MEAIDRKIYIKSYKEGNKQKTSITGLERFLDAETLGKFLKYVKKKLGCCGHLDSNTIIFSGNQVADLKKIIIDKQIAVDADIK